ncbi:hypothetical protein KY331_03100 [Candidatus Woesearchaeota archaeon]|nr:hypothetical protein [Candidatus Woesearchaeota archaeon]
MQELLKQLEKFGKEHSMFNIRGNFCKIILKFQQRFIKKQKIIKGKQKIIKNVQYIR